MLQNSYRVLTPPARIGIIGGGQLGKMMALEAKRMGYTIIILDPTPECPAGQVSDKQIIADFDDIEAIRRLTMETEVITYEFEHINSDILEALESEGYNIFPSGKTLKIIQNKYTQKSFLKAVGLPVPDFYKISDRNELEQKIEMLGFPAVLKTCTGGYDGKGNMILKEKADIDNIPDRFYQYELMLEQYIQFTRELSIMAVRSIDGESAFYPIAENIHEDSILRLTTVPASIDEAVQSKIVNLAQRVMNTFGDYGVFCIELFQTADNNIYINEIAPRPHNSGHYTIEGCVTSQFEQLIRIITGMPLGSTKLISPCAMVNILGDEKTKGQYTFNGIDQIMKIDKAYIHLYGKKTTSPLRKIGHITTLDEDTQNAKAKAVKALKYLQFKQLEQ